jgi:membrane protease YdiL (CAAX protease family)
MTRALRFTPGIAVAVVVVILACVNVIDVKVPHASLVLGPVCAAGLIALARSAGLDRSDLGLGKGTWRRGATWAAIEIAAVAVVFAVGAALPRTRDAFHDSRYHLSWPHALLTAFVLIPVGTVLLEEVAFRGVLWGLLREARGTAVATIGSSVLFGLWHVLPALSLATDNSAVGAAVGTGQSAELISVLGTVAFTGLTGVLFCELRRRSGSLLAPAGLHWATNALGVLASAAVWAWGTR